MSAPVSKCPDCILAARRAREQQQLAHHPVPTPVAAAVSAPGEGLASSAEEAKGRDEAIVARLKRGASTFEQLVAVVPGTLAGEARERACRNSVLRLKTKGILRISLEGYALA